MRFLSNFLWGVRASTLNPPLSHVNHWLNIGASLDGSYDGSANLTVRNPKVLTG